MSKRLTARILRLTLSVLALSLGMTGCESEDPTLAPANPLLPKAEGEIPDVAAPDSEPGWAFFPLQQGNRWEYARQFQAQLTPDGGEPQEPMLVEARIESQIAGTEVRDGVTYEILEQHWDEEGDTFTRWLRLRQDKSGLYEADVLASEPPMTGLIVRSQATRGDRWNRMRQRIESQVAEEGLDPGFLHALDAIQERHERIRQLLGKSVGSEATPAKASRRGGPQENELVRLAYPLHSKASWTVREDPMGTATVEGRDALHTPAGKMPAWRIRLDWDFLEPEDRVFLWYGRCGMLQFEAHTVVVATDEQGQRIGTIVADESEVLLDLDVQRGGCR